MAQRYDTDGWIEGATVPEDGTGLYVAYGSNLNVSQMMRRCPGAQPIGPTAIHGWRLVFRGCADITRAPGATCPAGLWRINRADERALDSYEGWPKFYGKRWVRARLADGRYGRVMVYVMRGTPAESSPNPGYLGTIRDGYADFGLDPGLLLDALVQTMTAERIEAQTLWSPRGDANSDRPFSRTGEED